MKLPSALCSKRKLSFDTYELCGDEIVAHRGLRRSSRVRLSDIAAWTCYPEMVFDIVEIRLTSGDSLVWLDKHDDLLAILRSEAKQRELTQ